ncbi:MAG: hypothetical protein EOO54_19475 [Haliea sp.]|nr:MAG: hypothetical protein EOO54_19475 [Haliea sp.]
MEKIIVYLDDAGYAQKHLAAMRAGGAASHGKPPATHWVLVACAPRLTHRISKWVSHSARENWRARWADKLFAQVVPSLQAVGDGVTTVLAKGPLPELTQKLVVEHRAARVLDARRPKFGPDMPPAADDPAAPASGRWSVPGSALGIGAMLVLALE